MRHLMKQSRIPTPWWYLERSFRSKKFFDLTTLLSVTGLTLGVASLIVAMAVFSGYEKTLRTSVQNLFGQVVVFNRGLDTKENILGKLNEAGGPFSASTPFLMIESVLAHKGVMNGVVLEGIEPETVSSVISLRDRLLEGEFKLSQTEPLALIGKGVASRFGLKVGDQFRLVVPTSKGIDTQNLQPKILPLKVVGILNFGRYDFDSRYIVTDIAIAQRFNGQSDQVSGVRLKIEDPEQARSVAQALGDKLGGKYWVRDWTEINQNLFEAVGLEKAVTFFILMILVVVACFNLASQLIVGVVRRYQDIAILKTCGAGPRSIQKIFTWHGLITGMFGCFAGFVLGVILCYALEWIQRFVTLVPPEVYKLDRIELTVEFMDVVFIFSCTLVVSFLSTLIPARLGSKMSPVKGLRYD